ncbi:MAG: hypothetical protein VX836_17945 [Pseudomonadota bacterium]|nr:hypothetical protein [Pseudomonadota bacterium]
MQGRLLLMSVAALSGCSGPELVRPDIPPGSTASTALVYREPAFNSGGATMRFGEDGKAYLTLDNAQFGEVRIASGPHRFTVGATGTRDFALDVSLTPNTTTCIKAYADPMNLAKVLTPILMNLTSTFKMEVVPCPEQEFLKGYERSS